MFPLFTTMLNLGPVLDVICTKAGGMRGQAHVVFRDVVTATTAMRALQNFMFLDKEMVITPIDIC
jgi:U2 small nuclear ribonucleoprotein B''